MVSRLGQCPRADDHPLPKGGSRRADRPGAARLEQLQRTDRRHQHRDAQWFAEQTGRWGRLRHVAQHPRPKSERVQRHPVARQESLGFRTANQVVPDIAIKLDARGLSYHLMQKS